MMPPIENLAKFTLDSLSSHGEWLQEFLEEEGYLRPNEKGVIEIEKALRRLLFENDPYEICQRLFPINILSKLKSKGSKKSSLKPENLVQDILPNLGIKSFPLIQWHYELASFERFLRSNEVRFLRVPRGSKVRTIKDILNDVWAKFEALQRITLIFYLEVFKSSSDPKLDKAFDNAVRANSIELRLKAIEKIEELFHENESHRQKSWQLIYRETPFGGLDTKLIRKAKNEHRNKVAHWDSDRVEEVAEEDARFVERNLTAIDSSLKELIEGNIAPLTMVIVGSGTDARGRKIYTFLNEWSLIDNKDNYLKATPYNWFCASRSKSYKRFQPLFYVSPIGQENGFFEPQLISRAKILAEYTKLTA